MRINPLVSVVVPVFNRETLILRCLASIQRQTWQDWEAIVVDDGSIDQTPDVVASIAREDPRIKLIRLPQNRGAQAARNAGIRAARGHWIAFLDSDDRYLPHSLEVRLAVAQREQVSVAHSSALVTQPDGRTEPYRSQGLSGWVYRDLLMAEGPMFPSLLVRREALERVGYLDEHLVAFQEWDTAIRLAKHYRFVFAPHPTFVWDRRQAGTISGDFRRSGRGYEQVMHNHYLAILRHGGPRALGRHYSRAARWYSRAEAMGALRRCQFLAVIWMALDPRSMISLSRRAIGHARRTTVSRLAEGKSMKASVK